MTTFQLTALILIAIWLVLVAARFRRSSALLIGGLLILGLYTLVGLIFGLVTPEQLGLARPLSWPLTFFVALVWLGFMLTYSPLADRLASRWFPRPPTLEAFRAIQQSRGKLIAGIVAAWVLGGVLEELVARGIALNSLETAFSRWIGEPAAVVIAILVAAVGAGILHLYQGPRAAVIITQLSILFGVLFVISGRSLWAVMLCHGLYDTIGFIRFANKQSKYSNLEQKAET